MLTSKFSEFQVYACLILLNFDFIEKQQIQVFTWEDGLLLNALSYWNF